jgi:GxxExxY protein
MIRVYQRSSAARNFVGDSSARPAQRDEPPMNADERKCNDLMERVLGAVFEVANILGAGFLEKVYERALLRELQLRGIPAVTQPSFPVDYKGQCVGHYFADILVDDVLVVELKCADHLTNEHMAQCLNHLRAWRHSLSPGELSKTDSGMETHRSQLPLTAIGLSG